MKREEGGGRMADDDELLGAVGSLFLGEVN